MPAISAAWQAIGFRQAVSIRVAHQPLAIYHQVAHIGCLGSVDHLRVDTIGVALELGQIVQRAEVRW